MSDKLKRRIQHIEEKLDPRPKATIDLVKHISDIRLEAERLMQLPQSDYEHEIRKPPHSMVNKVARVGVASKKRFESLNPEEQRRERGYPHLNALEFSEIQEREALKLKSPDNWVTEHLKKTRSEPV